MNGISTRFVRASLCVLIVGGVNVSCLSAKPKVQAKAVKKVAVKASAVKVPVAQKTEVLDVSQQLIQEVAKRDNCSLEKVKELIKAGADVNAQNKDKDGHLFYNSTTTSLMLAALFRRADVVKELIKAGADVNAKDEDGDTALLLALRTCTWNLRGLLSVNSEIVKDLIEAGADINAENVWGHRPLTYSWISSSLMKYLIDKGANINMKNDGQQTLLCDFSWCYIRHVHPTHHLYCSNLYGSLRNEQSDQLLEAIKILVDAGADLINRDKNGYLIGNPLALAEKFNAQKLVKVLNGSRGGLFGPLYSSMAWAKAKLGFNKKN